MSWFCPTLIMMLECLFSQASGPRTQAQLRLCLMLSRKSKGPNIFKTFFFGVTKSVKPLVQISSWVCSSRTM